MPTIKRKSLNGKLRQAVLQRDGFACKICGSKDRLVIHHIVPVREGGLDEIDNLLTLCVDCHWGGKPAKFSDPVIFTARLERKSVEKARQIAKTYGTNLNEVINKFLQQYTAGVDAVLLHEYLIQREIVAREEIKLITLELHEKNTAGSLGVERKELLKMLKEAPR